MSAGRRIIICCPRNVEMILPSPTSDVSRKLDPNRLVFACCIDSEHKTKRVPTCQDCEDIFLNSALHKIRSYDQHQNININVKIKLDIMHTCILKLYCCV